MKLRLKKSSWKWLCPVVFAIVLFLQCCIFHYLAFGSLVISSLWKAPLHFFAFYLPKLSIAVLIASIAYLFKNKYWTAVVSLLVAIWGQSELVYYRSNHIFMDGYTVTMAGNMDGFWGSVFMFFHLGDIWLYIPVILLLACVIICKDGRNYRQFFVALGIGVCLHIVGYSLFYKEYGGKDFRGNEIGLRLNPFSSKNASQLLGHTTDKYIRNNSLIHAFVYDAKMLVELELFQETYEMPELDAERMLAFVDGKQLSEPEEKLIIILVESFENWAITPKTMPALYDFIENHESIAYAPRVISQIKGGTSSDGQLIVNTGLLPINSGAVCFRFPRNTFPSLSESFKSSALIQTGELSVWNQKLMSEAYGIDTNYIVPNTDNMTFPLVRRICDGLDYLMVKTMASHNPFKLYSPTTTCVLPAEMPTYMADYLKCLHHTDSCWTEFFAAVDSCESLHNTTICVTGDHTVFHKEMRDEFSAYCKAHNESYSVDEAYTACIIYSPRIKEKVIIEEPVYQMDIYPTLLNLIGCEDYYWKGFGVNLLDSAALHNRPITEEEAYDLSDKTICSNWFNTYLENQ